MDIWLIVSCVLTLICIILYIKIYTANKSLEKIAKDLTKILSEDTNNLITISTENKKVKKIANNLNVELKKLRKAKIQYENGSESLKRTITNISHDMRTPLTAISGYVELLENKYIRKNVQKIEVDNKHNITNVNSVKGEKEIKQYIKIIKRKTNELIELTEQLFNFSTIIDTYNNLEKEECCINEVLEECLAEYYEVFQKEKVLPIIKLCKEKVYRKLNKKSLIRVFDNILSNTIKYGDGEFIVLLEKNGKITFSNRANDLDITSVQKIFDRYFTVENAKKSTGIGLSIAKQLVELNDGDIEAKYIDGNLIIEIKL